MTYIFILWSDGFDEAVASIFVAALRDAGLLVKVVGLSLQHTSGAHGLILVPDLTLDQALSLTARTICMIIPCQTKASQHLNNDPRVRKFIEQVNANQALLLVGNKDIIAQIDAKQATLTEDAIMVYPNEDQIIPFARDIAERLAKKRPPVSVENGAPEMPL